MLQKYKVFLETNYILFSDTDQQLRNWSGNYPVSIAALSNKFKAQLCYQVIDKNPEAAMHLFFAAFKYIRTAGALVQKINEDAYLWIYRFEHLDLPKGKIEKGETELAAAIREVQEETGLSGHLTSKGILGLTYHLYEMKGKSYFKVNHWFNLVYQGPDALVPQKEEGIEAVFWLSKKVWRTRLHECYPALKECIESTC